MTSKPAQPGLATLHGAYLESPVAYAFLAVFLVQSFHMVEHVAQVIQRVALGWRQAHGLIGFLDLESVHLIYNGVFLVGMAGLFCVCGFERRGTWASKKPISCHVFTAGLIIQGYHLVEHVVKFDQHLVTMVQGTPGILGGFFDLIWLHFFLNLVVYSAVAVPFFGYGFATQFRGRVWSFLRGSRTNVSGKNAEVR